MVLELQVRANENPTIAQVFKELSEYVSDELHMG